MSLMARWPWDDAATAVGAPERIRRAPAPAGSGAISGGVSITKMYSLSRSSATRAVRSARACRPYPRVFSQQVASTPMRTRLHGIFENLHDSNGRVGRGCDHGVPAAPNTAGGGGAGQSVRVATFHPASTVSSHSDSGRSVTHGTPRKVRLLLHAARVRHHDAGPALRHEIGRASCRASEENPDVPT